MALTDASALLAWLISLGLGMRFLERPGLFRAVALGVGVGLAQDFKYNGWLTGGIVIGAALLGVIGAVPERRPSRILKTFACGAIGAFVSWLVVWPWFWFVEAHGGYAALLRHQQSYLGSFNSWWPHFQIQTDQAVALSGGAWLILPGLVLAGLTPWIARPLAWVSATLAMSSARRVLIAVGFASLPWALVSAPYWLGLVVSPWLITRPLASIRLVGAWWVVLAVMSPFYHPYARLWLPYHAVNWLLMGWLVADGFAAIHSIRASGVETRRDRRRLLLATIVLLGLLAMRGGRASGNTWTRRPSSRGPSRTKRLAPSSLPAGRSELAEGARMRSGSWSDRR